MNFQMHIHKLPSQSLIFFSGISKDLQKEHKSVFRALTVELEICQNSFWGTSLVHYGLQNF